MKVLIYIFCFIVVLVLAWVSIGVWFERGVKEPSYKVERKANGYEVRQYQSYLLAEVRMPTEVDAPLREGFRMLFDYISGANAGNRKIKMTAPVLQEGRAAEKIPITKPVLRLNEEKGSVVSFVLPAKYTLQTTPLPENPGIKIREIASRRVAVIRFSGYAGDEIIDKQSKRLDSFLKRDGLKTKGAFMTAYYNPPWTPPFMRRNEVMVALE